MPLVSAAVGRLIGGGLDGGGGTGLPFTRPRAAEVFDDRPIVPVVVSVGVLRGGGGGGALGGLAALSVPLSLGPRGRLGGSAGGACRPERVGNELMSPVDRAVVKLSKLGVRGCSADGDGGTRLLSLGRRSR